jgi:ribosomal protein L40E
VIHTCHRCGAALEHDAAFCPQCAAPQLRVSAEDSEASELRALEESASVIIPTPGNVYWHEAIRACWTTAIAVGVLSSIAVGALQTLFFLWAAVGAIVAVVLYRRRTPRAQMSGAIGARIGLTTGIFAASVALFISAAALLLSRFVFHQGADIDKFLTATVQQTLDRLTEGNPQMANDPAIRLFATPDWRAALATLTAIFTAAFLVLFSLLGGAAGGRFLAIRARWHQSQPPQ